MWGKILVARLLQPLVENFAKRVFMDTVEQLRVGSVVYCGILFGQAEHSSIYVGRNSIVSLSDEGVIVKENPQEFLDGMTKGDTIYVSCKGKSPVGGREAAKRARDMIGKRRDYNLILDNCHQFTSGCLTGDIENAGNFLWMLKMAAEKTLGADTWRAWDQTIFVTSS